MKLDTEILEANAVDRLRILLVDDQDQKLLAYEAMLNGLGETVARAKTGSQALEILLREEVAVILLDVNMPIMDGFETAELIHGHPRFNRTPIIFVTAVNTTDMDRIRGYALGAVDYVSVPVVPEILRAKVSVFLELHRKTAELERANRSLAGAEQRMRAVLETANDGIVTMDRDCVVLTVNPVTEKIFGYRTAEMIGQRIDMLMPLLSRVEDGATGGLSRVRTGVESRKEIQGRRKNGTFVPLEIAISEAIPGAVFTTIIRDISRRKQLEREITEIASAEQRRIGQQLHDGVSQELTGLRMMASAAKDRQLKAPGTAEALLTQVIDGLMRVQEHVRQVSHGLIPVGVDEAGLRAALADLTERIQQQTSIDCSFLCSPRALVKDTLTATNLYHIAQEAANNALRHGRPKRIDIEMNVLMDALVLSIQDDGAGCVQAEGRHDGVGIRLMRHRASLIGGTLQIGPADKGGTRVTCTLPDWRRNNTLTWTRDEADER